MHSSRIVLTPPQRQRGVALMVMLIIVIIGSITFLVSSLSSSAIATARNNETADALAKAKEALIAYAVSDSNRPGELPCPDFDNDGMSTPTNDYSGSNCKTLVGWFPWKTLGTTELLDGNGNHLWYAVANPFHASSSVVLNSDTPSTNAGQMLTIKDGNSGATLNSDVVAIILSPGSALAGETRSANDNNATNAVPNYLEDDNANLDTVFKTANSVINDDLLALDAKSLFPPVEMRIAREVKKCLDDYAAASNNKYPWATSITDTTYYYGSRGTHFGRIASSRLNVLTTSSSALNYLDMMNQLQTALNTYNTSSTSTNLSNLKSSGCTLENAYVPLGVNGYHAQNAGDTACNLSSTPSSFALNSIQNNLTQAFSDNSSLIDNTMSSTWNCPLLTTANNYWNDWKTLVFYQLSTNYDPGTFTPSCGSSCLSINGAGSYPAVIAVSRKMLAQSRTTSSDMHTLSNYLEGANLTGSTSNSYVTYKSDTVNYSNVNDLVQCVGAPNCN